MSSSKSAGDPYINLAINILSGPITKVAGATEKWCMEKGAKHSRIFQEFMSDFGLVDRVSTNNIEPMPIALWVGAWLHKNHKVSGQCPVCKEQITVMPVCTGDREANLTYSAECPECGTTISITKH